jgi:hypothetical protein
MRIVDRAIESNPWILMGRSIDIAKGYDYSHGTAVINLSKFNTVKVEVRSFSPSVPVFSTSLHRLKLIKIVDIYL